MPLVEFVKTAEGRGSRTGKDLSQHYVTAPTSGSYYWAVGLVAGVVGALIAVLAVFQVRLGAVADSVKRPAQHFSPRKKSCFGMGASLSTGRIE